MLEYLTIAVPEALLDRSHIDPKSLADFERVTGITKTRRYEKSTSEMINQALLACGFDGNGIDNVIVVTQSPDRLSPCMAMEVHSFLHLPAHVPAFDVNHACDGWILGLYLAARLQGKTLLICADRLRYNKTPTEGLIFSDSVSIAVINKEDAAVWSFYTDGSHSKKLYCGLNGEMDMDGEFVFDFVVKEVPKLIRAFSLEDEIDFLVPHQANRAMNKLLASRSGFQNRWLSSIEEYGNQSMNSIPTAIVTNETKALGKNLLLCGFGAGMSAALMKIKWPEKSIGWLVTI